VATVIISATLLSIWYLNSRPDRIELVENPPGARTEARLLSSAGKVLHRWTVERPDSIPFAALVERPPELGGGRLAVVAFSEALSHTRPRSLRAFEASDLEKPLWEGRVSSDAPLPDPHERGYTGEVFRIHMVELADVFEGIPGEEIIVGYVASHRSQSIIRIYDLRGRVVYQFWHDGNPSHCRWLAEARLLVFLARNAEVPGERRGLRMGQNVHPIVLFAVRPIVGDVHEAFLKPSPRDGMPSAVWYRCLYPTDVVPAPVMLQGVTRARGRAGVRLRIRVHHEIGGLSWVTDEHGREIPGTRVIADRYKRNLRGHPKGDSQRLPDPNDFHLGPLPPIQPSSSPAQKPLNN
jgi:hypothetical protein